MEVTDKNSLQNMRQTARLGGGEDRIARQHKKGKQTARERINALLDPGTFSEIDTFIQHRATQLGMESKRPWGDGVVTGTGKINGRTVYLFAQDFTVLGGSVGEAHGRKIAKIMDLAYQNGAPLIGINDSGGARIQEGVDALAAYGDIFHRNVQSSGTIPQLSIILGPCAGGAVYSPAITDFVFMAEETAHMFITGPRVVKAVTQEEVDFESLGGAGVHGETSGVAHFTAPDEESVLEQVRWLLSYLPSNNLTHPPVVDSEDDPDRSTPELARLVPGDPKQPYDVRTIIEHIVDGGEFLEVQAGYARNLSVGFARMDGRTVGVIANQPEHFAGVLDIDASTKGGRFIRFCDAFHIPLLTLIDTPGFLPGIDQEHGGIIRHGAKLLYAYSEATVPKVSLILRKAYGGAYIVMSSKHLGGDMNFAWPQSEIAVMGPEGAVNTIFRKELAEADSPNAKKAELVQNYREEFATPFVAASRGYLDDVITHAETRERLNKALALLRNKREETSKRKHGNIPL
ncbi:MAG: Propionyl-CoA carboxylase beta chain [Chloroflexi bacterium]|nr:Propionyl-CoA carboxylase beta chain [Chloroflexota bacterium]